jgi:PAS domain S-box-containing protein
MSTAAAQIQFAAEFATFLVAAAGLALVLLRTELTTRRWPGKVCLTVGFLALGAAAFGHGSLLLKNNNQEAVDALRLLGVGALAAGSFWWRGGRAARQLLWSSLAVITASVGAQIAGAGRGADGLLAIGSVLMGATLFTASRRSIAARVAASAAVTLLLLVLVLSVALSAVISSSTQGEALNRLTGRARTEAQQASQSFTAEVQTARYVAAFLIARAEASLTRIGTPAQQAGDTDAISKQLGALQGLYPLGGLAYLVPPSRVIATYGVDPAIVTVLSGNDLVRQTDCPNIDKGSTLVVGGQMVAAAAFPICPKTGAGPVGIVLRTNPLDNGYLELHRADDPTISMALVGPAGVLAKVGAQPPTGPLTSVAGAVLAGDLAISKVTSARFLVAAPIQASGKQTIGAVVVSTPTSSVQSTRDRLFRALFVIALGGTLLALFLAALVGDRITAGLRQLTLAARSIQRGEVGQRAGITGDDEVGELGAAFDSMAASIEEQTSALQAAADDETRLRNRLEAVVAGMGDALVAVDAQGRITDFNQAAEELTGVTASDAIGWPVDEVVEVVNEDGSSIGPRLVKPSPLRWGLLATVVQDTGSEVPVALSVGALRGPANEIAGSVLVLRDLRREREVERMKTEFLSRVGHELRTPLTGIMGYADILLRRTVEADRARLWHEEILVAAKRLLRIVEMLEFFALSGAGRVLLRPEPLTVRGLVDGVVASWEDRLPAGHSLTRRVARSTPPVLGDRRWLTLAIDELVDNAVKFSPDGGKITITAVPLGVGRHAANNGHPGTVQIDVADRGKGMTADEQAIAFGEFVQGDSSDTRRFGGLGLGLSLVQRVVEGHGGSVSCVSTPGRGSVFTIVLPAAPPDTIVTDSGNMPSRSAMNIWR